MNTEPLTALCLERPEDTAHNLAVAALSLARCFAQGATLWCVSPRWPEHGRHIAVEFVHPVIVGKRALPAVHVEGRDVAATLRLLARPGDALVVVGADDADAGAVDVAGAEVADLLRRAEAWGLTRLWLGCGPLPQSGRAEHVIWAEGTSSSVAARSGNLVLLYHLLWELTHVVFEHPGLLATDPVASCEASSSCATCSDQALLGEVRMVRDNVSAEVIVAGQTLTVDVSLLDPLDRGDLILVHAGVALVAVDSGGA